jgi:hypothetical protein
MTNAFEPFRIDGVALHRYEEILASPEQYDCGPNGVYQESFAREAINQVIHPVWYVRSDDGLGTLIGPEVEGAKAYTARVGFNPDKRTELHVFGRLKTEQSG